MHLGRKYSRWAARPLLRKAWLGSGCSWPAGTGNSPVAGTHQCCWHLPWQRCVGGFPALCATGRTWAKGAGVMCEWQLHCGRTRSIQSRGASRQPGCAIPPLVFQNALCLGSAVPGTRAGSSHAPPLWDPLWDHLGSGESIPQENRASPGPAEHPRARRASPGGAAAAPPGAAGGARAVPAPEPRPGRAPPVPARQPEQPQP